MPKGYPNPKPEDVNISVVAASLEDVQREPDQMHQFIEPPKLVTMKLERHYVPRGAFEIVGYHKPEVKKKTATGDWKVVEPEEFVEGEACPPPNPGVGYPNKIWASTVIRVPVEEGKTMQRLGIAARDFD